MPYEKLSCLGWEALALEAELDEVLLCVGRERSGVAGPDVLSASFPVTAVQIEGIKK